MNTPLLPLVLRRWRFVAAVVSIAALAGGGGALLAEPALSTSVAFHLVTTTRVLDTRVGSGVPLGAKGILDVVVPGLPDDATGVAVNVTVTDGTQASYLTAYPTGDPRPPTSTINWSSVAAVANSATVQLHAGHSVRLYNNMGSVNVVIDLLGYYSPSALGSATGPAGPTGLQGLQGLQGPSAINGTNGTNGTNGLHGTNGINGTDGIDGVSPSPVSAAYASAYNTAAETLVANAAVTFDVVSSVSNPPFPAGIALTSDGSAFVVPADGVYRVSFFVVASEANQLSIRKVTGVVASTGVVFGALGHQPNVGGEDLTLVAGDKVSIVNLASSGGVDIHLPTNVGGTAAAVNAWIHVEQLNI